MKGDSRQSFSPAGLINSVHKVFSAIKTSQRSANSSISLGDHLMSGLAIFGLKFPSLLQYDKQRYDTHIRLNLQNLYHVNTPPSDTYLRECLDEVDPTVLRPAFTKLFSELQDKKQLQHFQFLDGYYLVSIDGTGEFSSSKVCCEHCCTKKHKDGSVTYYHQMLGACIVHPERSQVIPLCPEHIQNKDGNAKNDCERNAAKRFIENFRREHPHLKVIITEDGLASNGPHLNMLEANKMKYIIGAKPGDHEYLFQQLATSDEVQYYEIQDDNGSLHQFHFINEVSLNRTHSDLKVNVIEYMETQPNGKELRFSWVTNIRVDINNVYQLMRGGRARWKIENETYNTLKTLGYNFEHNYGHGKKYLASVFSLLMVLSFLIDQIQAITCECFKIAKTVQGTYRALWEAMRVFFQHIVIESWDQFYQLLGKRCQLDTS
jgi:hypothetical protein